MKAKPFGMLPVSGSWLRWGGSALLLAAAVLLLPKKELAAAFVQMRWGTPAAALAIFLMIHVLSALKWCLVVNRSGAGIRVRDGIESYFAGLFSNLFLPSLIGGDLVTAAAASVRARQAAGVVLGSVLNRLLDVMALAVLLSLAVALDWQAWALRNPTALRFIEAAAAGLGLAAVAGAVLAPLHPAWLGAALRKVLKGPKEAFGTIRRPGQLSLPLAASLMMQLGLAALTAWLGVACGISLGMATWVLAWSLAKLVALLPVTVSGIGARALALAGLLAPFGVPAARAAALGMAWDAVVVCGGLSAGVIWRLLLWRNRQGRA